MLKIWTSSYTCTCVFCKIPKVMVAYGKQNVHQDQTVYRSMHCSLQHFWQPMLWSLLSFGNHSSSCFFCLKHNRRTSNSYNQQITPHKTKKILCFPLFMADRLNASIYWLFAKSILTLPRTTWEWFGDIKHCQISQQILFIVMPNAIPEKVCCSMY